MDSARYAKMWLVRAYWKLCGVLNVDLSYNEFHHVYSVLLLATSAYNFISASLIMCKQDRWCEIFSSNLLEMYDRVMSLTVFLSRIAIVYNGKRNVTKYRSTILASETYSPASPAELKSRDKFAFIVVMLCLVIILPTNMSRLYYLLLYESNSDVLLLIYYMFVYVQNLSMCCVETQFVVQCFVIYTKFRYINGDLRKLRDNHVNRVKYSFVASSADCDNGNNGERRRAHRAGYETEHHVFYARSRFEGRATANTVETLRIRHWLNRQSINTLNDIFGIHMGLSVFYVWMVALFDIYYEIFHDSPSKLLVYGWIMQYMLRLFMIVLAAHYTTKQVSV